MRFDFDIKVELIKGTLVHLIVEYSNNILIIDKLN